MSKEDLAEKVRTEIERSGSARVSISDLWSALDQPAPENMIGLLQSFAAGYGWDAAPADDNKGFIFSPVRPRDSGAERGKRIEEVNTAVDSPRKEEPKFLSLGDSYINRDHIVRVIHPSRESATLRLSNGDVVEVSGKRSVDKLLTWIGHGGVHSLAPEIEHQMSDPFSQTMRFSLDNSHTGEGAG